MFSLIGKRILVTGASSGIGKQIAIDVASQGGIVTLLGRNSHRLEEAVSLLEGVEHEYFSVELTNQEEIDHFVNQQKPFDGVILNAGIIDYVPVKFINVEKLNDIFDTNFKSAVILSQLLLKRKLVNKQGAFVFISSIAAKLGVPGTALYAASKAALSSYSKVLASELASQKIRSNCICPGIIITPMTSAAIDASGDRMQDGSKNYPLGYGEPKDVAGLAVYLLSDESRWMTGTDLILDGGFTLK